MPDYSRGKIYQIISVNELPYVGSTTDGLEERLSGHKSQYNRWIRDRGELGYLTSFQVLMHEDAHIELIENYPCETLEQLREREGYWQQHLECVNKVVAGRKPKESVRARREANKDRISANRRAHRETNKAHRRAHYRACHEANKARITAYNEASKDIIEARGQTYCQQPETQNVRCECECGAVMSFDSLEKHRESFSHFKALNPGIFVPSFIPIPQNSLPLPSPILKILPNPPPLVN